MRQYVIYKGDFGFFLNGILKQSDGTAYDLEGITVKFKTWAPDTPGTLVMDEEANVDNEAGGLCHYAVQSGDFDVPGTYHGEWEATISASLRESFDPFEIVVKESG